MSPGLASYHRLLKTDEPPDHKQKIIRDCRRERQGETGKGCVHERENGNEGDAANDEARENVETGRDPPVDCAAVH